MNGVGEEDDDNVNATVIAQDDDAGRILAHLALC